MEGWRVIRLGDACDVEKEQALHVRLPYVGLEHIESGTGRFLGSMSPSKVKSSTFRFTDKHVLYGRLRPYLNKVLLPDFEGHCSTEIFPLRPRPELSRQYLFHWLSMDTTVKAIDATSTGARMPRANMAKVMDFEVPVPSLPEQRRIVAILDEVFDAIATARANTEKVLRNMREMRRNEVKALFDDGARSWPTRRLPDLSQNLDSRRIPITKSDRRPGEYPYYGASGIVDYVEGYIFDEETLLISEDGANLLARSTPIAFSVREGLRNAH